MREVQASEAKTHLPQLLDAVERGETIVITRHGRSIARLVPERRVRQEQINAAAAGLERLRESIRARAEKPFTLDEIKAYRAEGRS
jgi:prevent-host-death family protein